MAAAPKKDFSWRNTNSFSQGAPPERPFPDGRSTDFSDGLSSTASSPRAQRLQEPILGTPFSPRATQVSHGLTSRQLFGPSFGGVDESRLAGSIGTLDLQAPLFSTSRALGSTRSLNDSIDEERRQQEVETPVHLMCWEGEVMGLRLEPRECLGNASLSTRAAAFSDTPKDEESFIRDVLMRGPSLLRFLSTQGAGWITRGVFPYIAHACKRLQGIDLSFAGLQDSDLELVAGGCPELQMVNLSGTCIGDISLETLFDRCPKLEVLSISGCKEVSGSSFEHLGRLRGLRSLDVSYCPKLSSELVLTCLAQHAGSTLEKLDLTATNGLTDDALSGKLVRLTALRHLRLQWVKGSFTEAAMKELPTATKRLVRIDLTGLGALVTDEMVSRMAVLSNGFFMHVHLGCTGAGDRAVLAIAENCPEIATVELASCKVSTSSLMELLRLRHETLKKLDISNCPFIKEEDHSALKAVCPPGSAIQFVRHAYVPPPVEVLPFRPTTSDKTKGKKAKSKSKSPTKKKKK